MEEAGRAGKGRRGRSYRNRLGLGDCSTGEPSPASLHKPRSHQPALLLALHRKHSWPTSMLRPGPEGGTAADRAPGRQKHLTPSLLPGRAPGGGWGWAAEPGFPGSELPAALAGPRFPPGSAGSVRLTVSSHGVTPQTLPELPLGSGHRLGAGMKIRQRPSRPWTPRWGGKIR